MSRRVTWLVVGAVAAVGFVAAVDALHGKGEPASPPETSTAATAGREPAVVAPLTRGALPLPLFASDLDWRRLPFPRDGSRPVLLRLESAGIEEVRRRAPLGKPAAYVDLRFGRLWR